MVEVFKTKNNSRKNILQFPAIPLHCSKENEQASFIRSLRSSTCWPIPRGTRRFVDTFHFVYNADSNSSGECVKRDNFRH